MTAICLVKIPIPKVILHKPRWSRNKKKFATRLSSRYLVLCKIKMHIYELKTYYDFSSLEWIPGPSRRGWRLWVMGDIPTSTCPTWKSLMPFSSSSIWSTKRMGNNHFWRWGNDGNLRLQNFLLFPWRIRIEASNLTGSSGFPWISSVFPFSFIFVWLSVICSTSGEKSLKCAKSETKLDT